MTDLTCDLCDLDLSLDAPDGYPTEESLQQIERACVRSRADCAALLQAVRSIWAYADAGYWTQEGTLYRVSTAGWSGNESIIAALQANAAFFALCWESARRGGHYTFKVDGSTPDKRPATETELEASIAYLRGRGSPLVCPARDGVLVCKNGLHAFGPTLVEALDALDRKHAETLARRVVRTTDGT